VISDSVRTKGLGITAMFRIPSRTLPSLNRSKAQLLTSTKWQCSPQPTRETQLIREWRMWRNSNFTPLARDPEGFNPAKNADPRLL